jgi:hypothetical protein
MSYSPFAAHSLVSVTEAFIGKDSIIRTGMPSNVNAGTHERMVDFYLLAKNIVVGEGFGEEIQWQDRLQFSDLNESVFLREAAWVVLSSGMREAVVRNKFQSFSFAFYDWLSAKQISANAQRCKRTASRIFAHSGKIDSIIEICGLINTNGFDAFKAKIASGGVVFLRSLPFIGPATSYHLAKNIGFDVVKPDRHLLRISELAGYSNPAEMCHKISSVVGDRLSVVDLVVWRYATLNPGYRDFLIRYLH